MAKKTFEAWKAEVDAYLSRKIGLTSDDLDDWRYHDAWEQGVSPTRAANAALRNARCGF